MVFAVKLALWCVDLRQWPRTQADYSVVNGCFKLQINNELLFLLNQYTDVNQDLY